MLIISIPIIPVTAYMKSKEGNSLFLCFIALLIVRIILNLKHINRVSAHPHRHA